MDVNAPSYLDKLLSPLPWLPWIAVVLLGAALAAWIVLRVVDRWMLREWDFLPQIRGGNVAASIMWGVIVLAVVWAVVTTFQRAAFGQTARYDPHFRRAAVHHFGSLYAWQHFKAQGMAESALRPDVCSGAGACGLMQFMPGTAREMGIDPFRPRAAIWAGIAYDKRQWSVWRAPRPAWDRLAFALMSYNAGLGNVLDFQRNCVSERGPPCNTYSDIAPHSWDEPREYVLRISRWCERFHGWGCTPRE